MTSDDIIAGVLEREAGWRDAVQRPDKTWDPATNHGITLPVFRAWRHDMTLGEDALRELTPAEAGRILDEIYVGRPGFTPANIPFEPLRIQLIDFGVNSSPDRAVRWLQRALGFVNDVSGVLDAETLAEINRQPRHLLNDALVAARCLMITQAVAAGHVRREDERGLLLRAVRFTLIPRSLTP